MLIDRHDSKSEHIITVNDSTGLIFEISFKCRRYCPRRKRNQRGIVRNWLNYHISDCTIVIRSLKDKKQTLQKFPSLHSTSLLALAVLTFYPVFYGFYLSPTDASQTRLGDESFIGFSNFLEVFAAEGFLKVTIFTLVWTVSNVFAHIAIGLFLAILLNDSRLKGRVAYRTIMLLPWAIPSYISVLIWRGIFQPDGLLNDLLGTDLNR